MLRTVLRSAAAAGLVAAVSFAATAPALAGNGAALATGVVSGANTAIQNAMQMHRKPKARVRTVAQVPPVAQHPIGGPKMQGLPTGFTYTADFSMAYPYGNIGTTGKAWLPGGMDFVAGYGLNPTTRFVASYYELQHYPVGFNSGTVPLYLQGQPNPIGSVNLGTVQPQINVTTKDRFFLLNFEKLLTIKLSGGRVLPIVLTPTYVARTSTIAASPTHNDVLPFEPNAPNGFPIANVPTRTAQLWSLAVTLPFLKTPRMFGTFTVAPSWLTHPNGINQSNKAQLYQILYLQYTLDKKTQLFFEPQSSRDYLGTDPYPQHLMAYFLGVSRRIGKQGFVQLVLNSGGPTNEGPYGITALTCQRLPCSQNPVVPTLGGLKATQLQIQFGIGSPSVIQF